MLLATPPPRVSTHPGASLNFGPPSTPTLPLSRLHAESLPGPPTSCDAAAHSGPTPSPRPLCSSQLPLHLPSSCCSAPDHLPSRCCPPPDSTDGPKGGGGEAEDLGPGHRDREAWAKARLAVMSARARARAIAAAGRGFCTRLRNELPACLPVPMNLQPAPPSRPWNLQINTAPSTGLTPDSCPCKHSSDFLP